MSSVSSLENATSLGFNLLGLQACSKLPLQCCRVLGGGDDAGTPDPTSPSGGDETDLTTSGGTSLGRRGLTNMLMVTTTVGMLNRVHSNTTNLWPAVSLSLVLVIGSASLQQRLVNPTTASDDTDHGAVVGVDNLLAAGGHLNPGLVGIGVVGDNSGVVAGGSGNLSSVTQLLLQVTDNSTLGHLSNGKNVTDGKLSFLSTVDELSNVHTFGSNHELLVPLQPVGISELDNSEGSTTTRVVDDILYNTLDIAMSLSIVEVS